MNNMRRGFTMIELIFVIVIIGILAAVAIPKLAATRDDARISNIIANTRTALGDMTSIYTAKGNTWWTDTATVNEVTNVGLVTACDGDPSQDVIAGAQLFICDEGQADSIKCITFDVDENGTGVTITAAGGSVICDGVIGDPAIITLTDGTDGKIHRLGGSTVTR